MRWTSSSSKYYSKLYSYGEQHRTSTYLKNWTKVQRLKRDSPFSRRDKLNLPFSDVEPCLLETSMNPLKDLPRVFFHEEPLSFSSKKNQLPAHLRHLALKTILNTLPDAVHYFIGWKSKLIAINVVLKHMISIKGIRNIWIFTDSKSSIQYLSNWRNIGDRIRLNIIDNVKTYSTHNDIHLLWIPSHVELYFNDLADELAKEGSNDPDR
ncbi:RNase H domain-containing protein [Trichonephila clavipes]|nr:RNase H domain-containing protein [Trichonephila clavipes]